MTLTHILIFSAFALIVGWAVPKSWRGWLLLGGSLAGIYWLQPASPIRNLDFWLPTASITLVIIIWVVTQSKKDQSGLGKSNLISLIVILGTILVVGLTRYLGPLCCLTATRPPDLLKVSLALGVISAITLTLARGFPAQRLLVSASIIAIIGMFITLKTENLAQAASAWLRQLGGQSGAMASALDLRWLGFSYLAFRFLHVLRDYQAGKLPRYSLGEFVTYALFFPTLTAGPIDRNQRFVDDLRKIAPSETGSLGNLTKWTHTDTGSLVEGGQRILTGIFKKFVMADSLAMIALNGQNALQAKSGVWIWVLLYAYTLRIYWDFSGYTDIAIGIGRLLGFKLPENFECPYLKHNLTAFWNSWHITLAQWFRAYFFNPLTRTLRSRTHKLPTWVIILIGQFCTMALIGLWHGITWNFLAWGAWHGIGLFIHNRWSDWTRPRLANLEEHPQIRRILQVTGWFITFNYVSFGWVWFALPDVSLALLVFQKLLR